MGFKGFIVYQTKNMQSHPSQCISCLPKIQIQLYQPSCFFFPMAAHFLYKLKAKLLSMFEFLSNPTLTCLLLPLSPLSPMLSPQLCIVGSQPHRPRNTVYPLHIYARKVMNRKSIFLLYLNMHSICQIHIKPSGSALQYRR